MPTHTVSSCQLKNGLTLLCLDQSRKIASDRWYICVRVRITIPVEKKWFANHPVDGQKFGKIRDALGKEVVFQQKKERNFVSDDQKERIVTAICDRAVETGMKYLGRDDFAARYILKVYADQQRSRY